MLGQSCTFSNRQHVILHHEIISWVKRMARSEDGAALFLYFHLIERTFVIAKWTSPGKFVDVLNMGPQLYLPQDDAIWLRKQLGYGYDAKKLKQRVAATEGDYATYIGNAEAEMNEERQRTLIDVYS